MNDHDALRAAILANPDENAPRLVYADWLQENGDVHRAEFIRVQIELAQLAEAARDLPDAFADEAREYVTDGPKPFSFSYCRHYDPRRIELRRCEAELLHESNNREAWCVGLPKYAAAAFSGIEFRRGFVNRVHASLAAMMKDPVALWEHHPVEALSLTKVSGKTTTAKMIRCAHFARVRELSFPYTGPTRWLEPFAKCPHLANLRSLQFSSPALSAEEIEALAGSEHLKPEALRFQCPALSREPFEKMLNSPFASKLRELNAEDAGPWALEAVALAPLDNLRQLQLKYANCGDAGIRALTRSKHLKNLVTLGLYSNSLTDETAELLAAWPGLVSVRALDLTDADISGEGIEKLVASPYFQPAYLTLFSTGVGDIGAAALAKWPGLANLRVLDMRHAQVCDTGGLALARSPHWRNLRYLMLTSANFRRAHGPLSERFGAALSVSA